MEKKDYIGAVSIIIAIFSTLLIFAIEWWIVLIINFCAFVLFNLIFKRIETPFWLYFVEFGLCVGIMILVMCFPEKICGGAMQQISNNTYGFVKEYFKDSFKNASIDELIKRFYINVGICLSVLIIKSMIVGKMFKSRINKARKSIKDYKYIEIREEMHYSIYLSVPLLYMGALILANCPFNIWGSMMVAIIYESAIGGIAICCDYLMASGSDDSYLDSDNSSGSDDYTIIVIKN